MADYYTHISFEFDLPSEEAALAAVKLLEDVEQALDNEEDLAERYPAFKDFEWSAGVVVEAEGNRVWVHDDGGCPELEMVGVWLQEVLKAHDPKGAVGFDWGHDCSKHRVGAFGGGAVFVTAEDATWTNTSLWLSEQRETHQASKGFVIKDANRSELEFIRDRIIEFAAECEEKEYTDAGDAWELLKAARDIIDGALPSTESVRSPESSATG
jgi:hypothetical protein